MSKQERWTKQQEEKLYEMVQKSRSWEDIAKAVNKTPRACSRKALRIPKGNASSSRDNKAWSIAEKQRLYGLRNDVELSYSDIGAKLGRSPISCERMYQETDWVKTMSLKVIGDCDPDIEEEREENKLDQYAEWLMNLSRGDVERLESITKKEFMEKASRAFEASHIDFSPSDISVSFESLKQMAMDKLTNLGLAYPKEMTLGKGIYVIVGDSHGKHAKNGIFRLMNTLNKTIKPKQIIHLGHIFDDDGDISYHWSEYDNLLVVGMRNELKDLKQQPHKYRVVRDEIKLGNLVVRNQYDITDYVAKFVGSIKPHIFPYDAVINCHRHELFSRCTHKGGRLIASPGCLCEKHIVKTIKQMIFRDGTPNMKLTFPFGYHRYNRMEHLYEFWEQGMLIVEVDARGNFDINPCRIFKTSKGFSVSVFDSIITEKGVFKPDEKIMINGDMHCDNHDPDILDIQEQFCQEYKPDMLVNVGDVLDNRALNHHMMKRSGGPLDKDMLKEVAHSKYAILRMRQWAAKTRILYGNHERFMADFAERFPQMKNLLTMEFLFDPKFLDIQVTPLKHVLHIGPAKFIHGDMRMYGQNVTNKLERVSATFGEGTAMGNIHYPAIRSGCYSIGMTGLMDQGYNETEATQWMHGFGYCNIFEGKAFFSLVNIRGYRCSVIGRLFEPKHSENWDLPDFSASIAFNFNGKGNAPKIVK